MSTLIDLFVVGFVSASSTAVMSALVEWLIKNRLMKKLNELEQLIKKKNGNGQTIEKPVNMAHD